MQLQDLRILTSPKNFSDVKDKVTRGVFAIILNMIQALYSHVCPSGRLSQMWQCHIVTSLYRSLKKLRNPFFWEIFPKYVYPPTHPRVFVRFGRTKGEIWVAKRRFLRWFEGVLKGLDLVWESATPPTHIWERSPKKNGIFLASSLSEKQYKSQYTIDKIAIDTIEVILSDSRDTGAYLGYI